MAKKERANSARDKSWWDTWPDIFEEEMQAFRRHDVVPDILVQAKGILILQAAWPTDGESTLPLRVGYSPFHPFARPAVSAPKSSFNRHQDPIGKTLCLLPREPYAWNPAERVADYLHRQVGRLLAALQARSEGREDDAAGLEDHAPDPLMPYYTEKAEAGSVVLFDGSLRLPADNCGVARFVVRNRPRAINPGAFEAVLSGLERIGVRSFRPFALPQDDSKGDEVLGRWVRLRPPPTDDPQKLLEAADEAIRAATLLVPQAARGLAEIAANDGTLTAIVFPDEAEYGRIDQAVGCLFLATRQNGNQRQVTLVRGEALSDELFVRLPVAKHLRDKRVLLIGCGAIGSFVAAELARCGIAKLTTLDADKVRPGNSVRWLLGRPSWGISKTTAIGEFLNLHYPWTKTEALVGLFAGASDDPAEVPKGNVLAQYRDLIRESDIVIDATGSSEAQHALADQCRDLKVPYLVGYGTPGAAGGMVAYFLPGAPACLACLINHWADGADGPIPPLRSDSGGEIIPFGCNAPTFTGGSYDLEEISLQLVRYAVQLLAGDHDSEDMARVAVVEMQDATGRRTVPRWTDHTIPPHRKCCGGSQ